jgi:hypothetical protein
MATPEKPFSLTMHTIKDVQDILSYITSAGVPYRQSLTARAEVVLRYLEKSSDRQTVTAKGHVVNQLGDKSKIGNTEVAVLKIQRETACAYLGGTFLSGYPIFAATAARDKEDVAEMLTSLTGRDQDQFDWMASLLQCHEDVLIYPVCGVAVEWSKLKTNAVGSGIGPDGKSVGVAQVTSYEGNSLTRLDPNNLIFDTSVPPHEVHKRGTFSGYVERMSYVAMREFYNSLDDLYTIKVNRDAIFKVNSTGGVSGTASLAKNLYKKPQIHRTRIQGQSETAAGEMDWQHFWGGANRAQAQSTNLVTGHFEVVRMYVRIPLRDYGYKEADEGVHVCKCIWINGLLAYFEPMLNSHGMFGIVLGQFQSGDVNTTTFCEYLIDLQDLSTSLVQGALSSMRRAVGDRALYDPRRIASADINNPNPVSKIAVQMNTYNASFDNAYRQIPYNDNISADLTNMMELVDRLADRTTGQNQATQGNFVKGNKTREEFDTIMSNAQARMQLGALFLEQHFYSAIKQILRANYLLYAQPEDIAIQGAEQVVQVDPAQLRKEAPAYKMASGLMPIAKLAATDALVTASQQMSLNPLLSMEYDTGAMMISALKQMGLQGLDQYKRSPEEQQRMAMLQQPPQREPAQGTPPNA